MQFIFKPALLSSESEAEFNAMRAEIDNDIQPEGIIEQIFAHRFAQITWEICRYSLNKTGIIQNNFPAALQSLLEQLLRRDDYLHNLTTANPIIEVSENYFCDPQTKAKILETLRRFGLNGKAIEAEAFRLVLSELEKCDKMVANAERQRHKALKQLAQYRRDLAPQFRQVTDRIIARVDQPLAKPSASLDHGE
jgi:hypothetical protein